MMHDVFFGIRLVLPDHARDRARLLCRAAEQRPLRILAIEVVQDRERLEADVVAVLQHRHAAARIQLQQRQRLVLLLGELHQCESYDSSLYSSASSAATNTGCRCPTRFPMPWSRLESCAPGAVVTVPRSEQTISMNTPPSENLRR